MQCSHLFCRIYQSMIWNRSKKAPIETWTLPSSNERTIQLVENDIQLVENDNESLLTLISLCMTLFPWRYSRISRSCLMICATSSSVSEWRLDMYVSNVWPAALETKKNSIFSLTSVPLKRYYYYCKNGCCACKDLSNRNIPDIGFWLADPTLLFCSMV